MILTHQQANYLSYLLLESTPVHELKTRDNQVSVANIEAVHSLSVVFMYATQTSKI